MHLCELKFTSHARTSIIQPRQSWSRSYVRPSINYYCLVNFLLYTWLFRSRAGNRSCRVNERESFRATSSTYTYLSYRFVLRRTRLSGYKTAFRCSPLLNAKICANSLMVYEIVWPHCNYALKYLHHVPMGILDSGLLVRRSWLLIAVLINNNK